MEGVWSPPAHEKKGHPLSMAKSPTPSADGRRVYLICGFGGCAQRLEVDAAVWRDEERRRREASEGWEAGLKKEDETHA